MGKTINACVHSLLRWPWFGRLLTEAVPMVIRGFRIGARGLQLLAWLHARQCRHHLQQRRRAREGWKGGGGNPGRCFWNANAPSAHPQARTDELAWSRVRFSQDFTKVLQLEPEHVNAAYSRAACQNLKGEFEDAIGNASTPRANMTWPID